MYVRIVAFAGTVSIQSGQLLKSMIRQGRTGKCSTKILFIGFCGECSRVHRSSHVSQIMSITYRCLESLASSLVNGLTTVFNNKISTDSTTLDW